MPETDEQADIMEMGERRTSSTYEYASDTNDGISDSSFVTCVQSTDNEEDNCDRGGESSVIASAPVILSNSLEAANSSRGPQAVLAGSNRSSNEDRNDEEFWIPSPDDERNITSDGYRIITFEAKPKPKLRSLLPKTSEFLSGWCGALVVFAVGIAFVATSDPVDIVEEVQDIKEDMASTSRFLLKLSLHNNVTAVGDGLDPSQLWLFTRAIVGSTFFDAAVVSSYELTYKVFEVVFMLLYNGIAKRLPCKKQNSRKTNPGKVRCFHQKDALRVIPVVGFFAVGIPCSYWEASSRLSWGKILLSTGLIYIAIRAMFFVPQPDDEIRNLKNMVAELETSVALGLADGYFENFLKHVLNDLKCEHERRTHDVNITYQDGPTRALDVGPFAVAIPRHVDWGTPITKTIASHKGSCIFDCHIEPAQQSSQLRPRTVSINHIPETDAPTTSVLFDIPTTLQVIIGNIEGKQWKTPTEMDDQYLLEINRFACRLAWKAYKERLEEYVRIIEIEHTIDERVETNSNTTESIFFSKIYQAVAVAEGNSQGGAQESSRNSAANPATVVQRMTGQ